jgi:hypothetical protein
MHGATIKIRRGCLGSVLMKFPLPAREKITGGWRKMYKEEFNYLHSSKMLLGQWNRGR